MKKDKEGFISRFYKRVTHNGTLPNEYRLFFDPFENIFLDDMHNDSARKPVKINYGIFLPCTHYVADLAAPMRKYFYCTDTMKHEHTQCWKESTFENYDKNAEASL